MGGVVDTIIDIVEDVVEIIVDVVETVIQFVGDIVGFVFNPMGAFDTPTGPQNPEQEARGVTITKSGTNVAIPVVYGFRRVGGNVIYIETNGETNKYLYAVYAISEGDIHGVKRILVEDVELPLPDDTYATGGVYNIAEGRFKDRIQVQVFNGSELQDQSSLANEAPNWKTKKRTLPGVAYAVLRFEWKEIKTQDDANNNPFGGGIPKVQFDVLGKKIYDVRNHGTGKQLSADYASLPKAYNFNPANCLLDYLLNPRYGCGLNIEEIDAESFKIAANKFEQTVTYYTGQAGRAMTMNAVVDTNAKLFDNVKGLVGGCRGIMPYTQGRYKLKVEDGGNATDITSTTVDIAFDVTKNYVIGGITLDGERKNTKYNEVIVNYIDPDQNFTNQQVFYSVNGDQAADNNELLRREFNFPTLTNKSIAQDLALLIYKKSRKQRTIQFNATQELINVEVGDIIRVTDTVLNLSSDTFRVVDIKLNLDLSVAISAVEHDATIYPFTDSPQVEIPPALFLPDELSVRPRQRVIANPPIGIVPPNDPDFDSAGDVAETNPLPPVIDRPITEVIDFIDDIDNYAAEFTAAGPGAIEDTVYTYPTQKGYTVPGDNIFFKISTSHGLCFASEEAYPATHNIVSSLSLGNYIEGNSVIENDFIFARNVSAYIYGPATEIKIYLNFPTYTTITQCRIYGYAQDGTNMGLITQVGRGVGVSAFVNDTKVPFNYGTGIPQGTPQAVTFKVKWVQTYTNGQENEIDDGGDLGQDYTYYNAETGTTKTGRTISAYLSHIFQNKTEIFGSLRTKATTNSVQTNHNLGG